MIDEKKINIDDSYEIRYLYLEDKNERFSSNLRIKGWQNYMKKSGGMKTKKRIFLVKIECCGENQGKINY